jgi:hypothetical protein
MTFSFTRCGKNFLIDRCEGSWPLARPADRNLWRTNPWRFLRHCTLTCTVEECWIAADPLPLVAVTVAV